jgi:DNA-binding LacI/PurR family transcriptional regulator
LQLANEFGLKERPVRDAVKTLVEENKLYTINGRGIFIFDPDIEKHKNIMFLVDSDYILNVSQQIGNFFLQMEVYKGALEKTKELGWKEYFYSFSGKIKDVITEYNRQKCTALISMAVLSPQQLNEVSQQLGSHRFIDTQFDKPKYGYNEVRVDFNTGIRALLEKAYELGHHNIAMLYGENFTECASQLERFHGFLSFCQEKKISITPSVMLSSGGTELEAYRKTNVLLDSAPETTFIFAVSDERAKGVIHALKDRGLTPGREISVAGFDNAPCAAEIDLATVAVPRHEVGRRAVEIMNRLLRSSQAKNYSETLESYPVLRSSLGPAPCK